GALLPRAVQRTPDDRARGLAPSGRMILAHADHSISLPIYTAVGVTHFGFRRDRPGRSGAVEAIQALIGEVREIDHAVAYRKTASAVFVDARAGVERNRREVGGFPILRAFSDHVAAFFLRPRPKPVNILAFNCDLHKTDRAGNDQIGSDRRFPRTVARNLRFSH